MTQLLDVYESLLVKKKKTRRIYAISKESKKKIKTHGGNS